MAATATIARGKDGDPHADALMLGKRKRPPPLDFDSRTASAFDKELDNNTALPTEVKQEVKLQGTPAVKKMFRASQGEAPPPTARHYSCLHEPRLYGSEWDSTARGRSFHV